MHNPQQFEQQEMDLQLLTAAIDGDSALVQELLQEGVCLFGSNIYSMTY